MDGFVEPADKPPAASRPGPKATERQARLAAALRQNLKRRKEQERGRAEPEAKTDADREDKG